MENVVLDPRFARVRTGSVTESPGWSVFRTSFWTVYRVETALGNNCKSIVMIVAFRF